MIFSFGDIMCAQCHFTQCDQSGKKLVHSLPALWCCQGSVYFSTHQMHIHFAEYVYNKLQALNILLLFLIGLLSGKIYQNYFMLFPLSSHVQQCQSQCCPRMVLLQPGMKNVMESLKPSGKI